MKLYSVVNMDIVGSRNVKDREQLQINLNNYIEQMNKKFSDILVAPITITLGDEWQLITDKPSQCYSLLHEFQQLLWKDSVELYAGIGIGELSTSVYEDIRKMDGPCFHAARDAMNIVKDLDKLKTKYSINKLNKVFLLLNRIANDDFYYNILDFYYVINSAYTESALEQIAATKEDNVECSNPSDILNKLILERTINLIIENNEILKAKMTCKQKEVYADYSRLGSYRKIVEISGEDAKESIGGISQKLNNASFFTIRRNHQMISLLLDTYCSMGA